MQSNRNDLIIVFGLFILLAIAWSITGGPIRKYTVPTFTSDITTEEEDGEIILSTLEDESVYKDQITLNKRSSNIKAAHVEQEYIVIEANKRNDAPIRIDGWEIRSLVSKSGYTIPKGVSIPRYNSNKAEVLLAPGGKAIISSGRSPVGDSFKLNICAGYLEQFQTFYPKINKSCPLPEDEIDQVFKLECTEFIEDLNRCEMRIDQIPVQLSSSCQEFINTKLNYNGCVDLHKDDSNFYGKEWRLFLGRNQEVWKERREIISLFDSEGNVVDTITY